MTPKSDRLMPSGIGQIAHTESWGTGGSAPTYGGHSRGGGDREWLHNNPLMIGNSAISLGNVHSYGGALGPDHIYWSEYVGRILRYGDHEAGHTAQSYLLGPLYLPTWLGGAFGATVGGGHWHGGNFMERWAERNAAKRTCY